MSDPVEVLEFWLGEIGPEGWYAGGDEIDALCRERFGDLWQAAHDGGLEHWVEGTVGTLAAKARSTPPAMTGGRSGTPDA